MMQSVIEDVEVEVFMRGLIPFHFHNPFLSQTQRNILEYTPLLNAVVLQLYSFHGSKP